MQLVLSEAAPAGDPGLEETVLSQLVLYFSQRLAAYRQPLWKDIEVSMHACMGGWVDGPMQQLLAYVQRSALCARKQPRTAPASLLPSSSALWPDPKPTPALLLRTHARTGHRRPGRVAARQDRRAPDQD